MAEDKKPRGAAPKPDDEKQTTFTVNCKKKNVNTIKPMVKRWVKELDKQDWSKITPE